ncbi:MAG TPA: hypothetical protein VGT78_11775 [Rhizomicrobium sp.]|nr:hypothetical protein [Rhizomicrobium sp.]
MDEVTIAPSPHIARFWAFVGTAFILGPVFSYCFGLVTQWPIFFGFPAVAIALFAVSIAFKLWNRASSIALKIGIIFWVLLLAWLSPSVLVFVLDLSCAVQNSRVGHYVCGL